MAKDRRKRICVVTATRAEYGLLRPIIKQLKQEPRFDVKVAVTGAHLSPEFGLTYREIEQDQIEIDKKIEILLSGDTPSAISKSMGLALIGFSEYFDEIRPDSLLVLGDRYETLAVCAAAMNARIPIIHLYGGETTEGAIDEAVRHSITKMSYLHLTSTERYRKRVIQLGEDPSHVFCVGAIGVENALKLPLLSREVLEKSLAFSLDKPYGVVTFHPVTLEEEMAETQCDALLKAIDAFKDIKFIFTKANADANGRIINSKLENYAASHDNSILFDSLGQLRYLSALKYASFVLGNSSSGLVEAPSFHIPTINIGDRQKGRIQAESVINCQPEFSSIVAAMETALSESFKARIRNIDNPYGKGDTSKMVAAIVERFLFEKDIQLKKTFYDIDF